MQKSRTFVQFLFLSCLGILSKCGHNRYRTARLCIAKGVTQNGVMYLPPPLLSVSDLFSHVWSTSPCIFQMWTPPRCVCVCPCVSPLSCCTHDCGTRACIGCLPRLLGLCLSRYMPRTNPRSFWYSNCPGVSPDACPVRLSTDSAVFSLFFLLARPCLSFQNQCNLQFVGLGASQERWLPLPGCPKQVRFFALLPCSYTHVLYFRILLLSCKFILYVSIYI